MYAGLGIQESAESFIGSDITVCETDIFDIILKRLKGCLHCSAYFSCTTVILFRIDTAYN